MSDSEGIQHEIECELDMANRCWIAAKEEIRAAEAWQTFSFECVASRPLKMAARIGEIMAQLEGAHKHLIEAAKLQREADQQEAAA